MDSSIASTCWLPTYIKRVASHVQLRHCTIALESDPPAIIWPVFQGHEVSFRHRWLHPTVRLHHNQATPGSFGQPPAQTLLSRTLCRAARPILPFRLRAFCIAFGFAAAAYQILILRFTFEEFPRGVQNCPISATLLVHKNLVLETPW